MNFDEGCFQCPFCPESYDSSGERDDHASEHKSTRSSVDMHVNGRDITLARRVSGLYGCPGASCDTEGSIGTLWLHFNNKHLDMLQPSAKKRKPDSSQDWYQRNPYTPPPNSDSTPSSSTNVTYISQLDVPPFGKRRRANKSSPPPPPIYNLPKDQAPDIQYDVDKALLNHPDVDDLFVYLGGSFSNVVDGCAGEGILKHGPGGGHFSVYACGEKTLGKLGEYKLVFTKALRADDFTVCFRCWCPPVPAFGNHPLGTPCANWMKDKTFPNRSKWEDRWRVLAYLVFRVRALRETIFTELGIEEEPFEGNIRKWAAWLMERANEDVDQRITNLVIVAYTYFRLRQQNQLPIPAGGFKIDEEFRYKKNPK